MDFFLTCCSILAEGLIFKAASASLLLCANYHLSLSPFLEEVEDITILNIEEKNMKESQTEFCSDCV